ncbi:MAG TPA: GMC family oxidoreductase N-terminal domain-containing protein [Ramlibacter sp.]|nr:GMC family oxidoreductase N-terminal domain-containing protein [Ramlibacter sp.]
MTQPKDKGSRPLEFDYVVVGAGAAGCLLAARLSQAAETTVCLIEAGPSDRHLFIAIPAGFTKMVVNPRYIWDFATEPAEGTAERPIRLLQGRTLGGSTSINGMIFTRGQPQDFDGWRDAGNPGWGFEDVLPHFKRIESRGGADPQFRGEGGGVKLTEAHSENPAIAAFMAAAQAAGLPFNADYNGASQEGVAVTQQAIAGGRRMSSSAAFLRPARQHRNLEVLVESTVRRVLFEGRRDCGVELDTRGSALREIRARREVILCCGSLNTPRLLQVSGVADAHLLRELGVPLVHHLPGVGENLQDHYLARVVLRGRNFTSFNEQARGLRLVGEVGRYLAGRPSLLALCPSPVHFFTHSGLEPGPPDLQGLFVPANYKGATRDLDDRPGMTCAVWQHRPLSRGHVRAVSPDIAVAPRIQPNYLAHPHDQQVLVRGLRFCRELLSAPLLQPYVDHELLPGPGTRSDAEWLQHARATGSTVYHPVGTARMGPAADAMSVVDAQLRVHGVQNLRVVDASVMPTIPSGNTGAATMMIADKAADLMLRP